MKQLITLLAICAILSSCNGTFNKQLLSRDKNKIDSLNKEIRYYDDPFKHYYLLTFFKTFEKNIGEDFSFEGVNTYKNSPDLSNTVEEDSAAVNIQHIAMYFFRNGGVVYHAIYGTKEMGAYEPLKISGMEDFYKKSINSKGKNILKEYLATMHGYQLRKIDRNKINVTTSGSALTANRSAIDSLKSNNINQSLAQKELDYAQIALKETKRPNTVNKDTTDIKIYLERTKSKGSAILVGKHIPNRNLNNNMPFPDLRLENNEAILIESIYFEKEINSSGGKYTQALLDRTFNLGTLNTDVKPSKALFWFRLQSALITGKSGK